jgi:cellulose synthase/poly-beta-1,6-N-acetylglucosamine synthase-like glycosyltransferase
MEKQNGPLVVYHARKLEHGTKSYFKAGNLQYGIDITGRSKEPSEYIAGLDADMIPEIDWLRRMVPHLILDDRLGIACPPQVKSSQEYTTAQGTYTSSSITTTSPQAIP